MEMVKLTERLGSYFGTDEGLLIVRAPNNEDLKLEDGDVLLNIDGREPTSVAHALRILGSYQSGEILNIEVMRDKRKRTLEVVMPDSRRSQVIVPETPAPAAAPTHLRWRSCRAFHREYWLKTATDSARALKIASPPSTFDLNQS